MNPKVIISGGGTGGHIYPAIAIANGILARWPKAEILFVGALGRMEMEKVPQAGFAIEGLWISGLQRKITIDNLSFPLKVISSLWKARKIIMNFKPDLAIGVGGYASGPLLRMAAFMGVPSMIQEQNSFPGITNKLLSRGVTKICVAYEGMGRWFAPEKTVMTGNPVRADIALNQYSKEDALKKFDLGTGGQVVLVLGGSLGARTINESIQMGLEKLKAARIRVVWQTGKTHFENFQNSSDELIRVMPFINDMPAAFAAADIIVSRAGAMSISELCVVGKPLILVPSPNVAEDHQNKNAQALQDKDAAVVITDLAAREQLCDAIVQLCNDHTKQAQLSSAIIKLARPKATEDIVNEVTKLLKTP